MTGTILHRVVARARHTILNTTARYTGRTRLDLERGIKQLEWI